MDKKFDLLMFIDDDEATNYYHEIIVNESDVCKNFIFFSKAFDALDYFSAISSVEQIPNIIFLDINMPKMDGWQFLEHFSKLNIEPAPKIVMLTTSLSSIERDRADKHPKIHTLLHKSLSEDHLNQLKQELLVDF